jgi:hypothetical protein
MSEANKPEIRLAFIVLLLIITTGNFMRLTQNQNIRTVDFVNIMAIGMLLSALIFGIIQTFKKEDNQS